MEPTNDGSDPQETHETQRKVLPAATRFSPQPLRDSAHRPAACLPVFAPERRRQQFLPRRRRPCALPAPCPDAAPARRLQDRQAVTLRNTPRHIFEDQAAIWTSPVRLRPHDLEWLAPLAAGHRRLHCHGSPRHDAGGLARRQLQQCQYRRLERDDWRLYRRPGRVCTDLAISSRARTRARPAF